MNAIPTVYASIQFRSRLEATWAAYFDRRGWAWEYEPCDFPGWIPDFLLTCNGVKCYVEVKPVASLAEIVVETAWDAADRPVIVCGVTPGDVYAYSKGAIKKVDSGPKKSLSWAKAKNAVQWRGVQRSRDTRLPAAQQSSQKNPSPTERSADGSFLSECWAYANQQEDVLMLSYFFERPELCNLLNRCGGEYIEFWGSLKDVWREMQNAWDDCGEIKAERLCRFLGHEARALVAEMIDLRAHGPQKTHADVEAWIATRFACAHS